MTKIEPDRVTPPNTPKNKKGEKQMKFNEIKAILSRFNAEIKAEREQFEEKKREIKSTYLPEIQESKLKALNDTYNSKTAEIRGEYLHIMKTTFDYLKRREQGKNTHTIDFELLHQLDFLSKINVPLSKREISELAIKCVNSGSLVCQRKVISLAKESGFELKIPNEQEAVDLISEATEKAVDIIRNFDGNEEIDNTSSADEIYYKLLSSGDFIDQMSEQWKKVTVSEIEINEYNEKGELLNEKDVAENVINFDLTDIKEGKSLAEQYLEEKNGIEISGIL